MLCSAISCVSILPDPSKCLAINGYKYASDQCPQCALERICHMWHVSLIYFDHQNHTKVLFFVLHVVLLSKTDLATKFKSLGIDLWILEVVKY